MRRVSAYLAYLTKVAAAFGVVAVVLLNGGNANAQTACFGVGPEALSRALAAIEAVDIEVDDIDADASDGDLLSYEIVSIDFSIEDEDSCLASERTGLCVIVVITGVRRIENRYDSAPTSSGSGFNVTLETEPWIYGERNVTAQVRVRYYGAGGAYTSWSPSYTSSVEF